MSKTKQITVDEHRELGHMKSGPMCQKHYANLPECNCDKYEHIIEMWENIADSKTYCFGGYNKELKICKHECMFRTICEMKNLLK